MVLDKVIPMLVSLIPFTVFGLYKFMIWMKEKFEVRKGKYKVVFRLPNFRKQYAMLKPDKDNVKISDRIYPFSNSAGFVYFNGNTPEIEYDASGEQINFLDRMTKSDLDASALNSLAKRTYNLGKKHGSRKDNILLVGIIITAGMSALSFLLLYSQTFA